MNWDRIEGNWKQVKGKVKEQWGKLTDDDIDVIAGKRDQLVGKIQRRPPRRPLEEVVEDVEGDETGPEDRRGSANQRHGAGAAWSDQPVVAHRRPDAQRDPEADRRPPGRSSESSTVAGQELLRSPAGPAGAW